MEPRLIQQQSQRLILSPQIRQYLRLLQLPITALEQAVDAELTENPLLEEISQEAGNEEMPVSSAEPQLPEKDSAEEIRLGESLSHFDELDENFKESYYPDFSLQDRETLEERKNFQETLITKPETLSDFLLWQTRFLDLTAAQRKIAEEIIGNINEDGYLQASLEEIAQACQTALEAVETVLFQIQTLEPPGIGARNLGEALLIQLRKKEDAQLAVDIVANHLPLLEKRDLAGLARVLSVDIEEVKKAVSLISGLEPRPGRTFYVEESLAVTPDATVSFAEDENDGKYKIEIHDEMLPAIRINSYYRRLLRDKDLDEKSKLFLKEKMQSAVNFLRALHLRKSTLREITEEIVKTQADFFEKGFLHLKPLRLKDIANNIGIHESTVSRAIQGKYISTPQGTIPYKSFFSTKLETTDGNLESQKSIMERIKMVVGKENPEKPFSDVDMVQILRNEGIVIARRTVAKYRDLLKILPSHLRRKR